MDMPQFEAGANAYIIYRDVNPGEPFDPTSPLAFFPPKNSDELFDALRLAFPHLKTHSERMRDAIIQFLLDERLGEQPQPSPAMTMETMENSTTTWPSVSSGYASSSVFTSPDLPNFGTPASFADSPQLQSAPLTRQVSGTASTQSSPPSLDQMTGVFSLSSSAQTKQRTRRKMTEAEKVEYQKRRIVKACEKCAKKKRKCVHNQTAMQTLSSSVAKVTKSTSVKPAKATKVTVSPLSQHSYDTHLNIAGIDVGPSVTPFIGDDLSPFDDPLPELTLDDFINFEHFQRDSTASNARDNHFASSSFPTSDWDDFTLLESIPHDTHIAASLQPFNRSIDYSDRLSQPRAASQPLHPSLGEQIEARDESIASHDHQHALWTIDANEEHYGHQHARRSIDVKEARSIGAPVNYLSPHEVQHVPRPSSHPTARVDAAAATAATVETLFSKPISTSFLPTALNQNGPATVTGQAHETKAGSLQTITEQSAQQGRLLYSVRSRAGLRAVDVPIHPEPSSSRAVSTQTSTSVSTQSDSSAQGVAALQGRPRSLSSPKDLKHHVQSSAHSSSPPDIPDGVIPTRTLTLGEGLRTDVDPSTELFRLRRRIPTSGRRTSHAANGLNANASTAPWLQTRPSESSAPLSSRQVSSSVIIPHSLANDHADVRLVSRDVADTRTAHHLQTSSSSNNHAEVRPQSRDIRDIRTAHQLASAASGNAASSPAPLGVHTDLLSDHHRFRDHHGRASAPTPALSQNWFAAGMAMCALLMATSLLLPSVSISMAVLALLSPSSSIISPSLSNPDGLSSSTTTSKKALAPSDHDRALKRRQYLRGSGDSACSGAQGWLTCLMFPFELAPMSFVLAC